MVNIEQRLLEHLQQQRPWEEWFRELIPSLAPIPNSHNECTCRSPVPGINDHTPSASVNIGSGLWKCFRTGMSGSYIDLWAIMNTTDRDERNLPVYDKNWAVYSLASLYGLMTPVDEEWLKACQARLRLETGFVDRILRIKPWTRDVLINLGIGYDPASDALVLPQYLKSGELLNCRLYSPGREPKMRWLRDSMSANIPFPVTVWRRGPVHLEPVVLVEGEPDAITLCTLGFNAVSGTGGAGSPVPEGRWFWGRPVYVCFDADAAGQKALEYAIPILRRYASAVVIVTLPDWPNKPSNADVSDYILYLRDVQGLGIEGQQQCMTELFQNGQVLPATEAMVDDPPVELPFTQAMSSQYLNRRIEFMARVSAKSDKVYSQPVDYEIVCPHGTHKYCTNCPMHREHSGHLRYRQDPRLPLTLSMVKASDRQRMDVIKRIHGIWPICHDVDVHVIQAVDVAPVVLAPSTTDIMNDTSITADRHWREAFILTNSASVKENADFMMSGMVYSMPQTQQLIFLLDRADPISPVNRGQDLTMEQVETLKEVFHGDNVIDTLDRIAGELEARTRIIGRRDLHHFYRTIWHSVIGFEIEGKHIKGWLDGIVVGDTRCGKSATFDSLQNLYQVGYRCDSKHQTAAGLLGTVVISQNTGERFVVAGLLPRQDCGIVAFDEYQAERTSLIDGLSVVRAEGIVKITKTASAEFPARVRFLWLANPGVGQMMQDIGKYAVELLPQLVSQPEDVARFDMAMAVGSHEIESSALTNGVQLPPPRISAEMHQLLLSWVYSRRPDQITFTPAAVKELGRITTMMAEKYDPSIPLVEPADQRSRIARVAVSVAAQVFSTVDGEKLIVGREHVTAAEWLFKMWYDKPLMGYDMFSAKRRTQRTLRDEEVLQTKWQEVLGDYGSAMAELLLSLEEVSEKIFRNACPIPPHMTQSLLQELSLQRAIRPSRRGRSDSYVLTPPFIHWLQKYLKER